MVKKYLGLAAAWAILCLLLCGVALAEKPGDWVNVYDKAPVARMTVSFPEGMEDHAVVKYADGRIEVLIKASEMSREDWKAVMIDGGYPHVSVRPGVKRPSGYTTCIAFSGGIFDCVQSDFFNSFANELKREGVWYNGHEVNSNGESVGEIVAEQCMLIPEPSSSGGGGYFICWMDADGYQAKYPAGHTFTAEEIRANQDDLFKFEYVEIIVRMDLTEPFYVPFRSVSAAMMQPTKNAALPGGISIKEIKNGDIVFKAKGLTGHVDTPVVFDAPAGAAQLVVYPPAHENWKNVRDRIDVVNDRATYYHQVHEDVCVSEEQLAAVWLDDKENIIDYGIFWFHVETEGYKPSGWYVSDWSAPPMSRVQLINNSQAAGVETSYDPESGIFHIGYDEVDEVSGEVGWVGIRVKAPEGATAARINHGGGNQIMGPRDSLAEDTRHIIVEQSYIDTQTVDKDGYITVIDMEPLRHYKTGPVDVYLQFGSVWPYGGGQSVIYWYKDTAAAEGASTRGTPMKIEYVADTSDVICVTSRTEIVEREEDITERVEHVTCVKPGHGGKGWHLVIRRYPQRGDNACHWDFHLENECGDYEPLEEKTVFYMPYPSGHGYDAEKGYAVDRSGNQCDYAIYHYNSDYDACDPVDAQPRPFGIRFEVSSLSPFVLDWGSFKGDMLPDTGEGGDGGNDGDDGGDRPSYQLKNLHLNRGESTVNKVSVRNVQTWNNARAQFNDCRIENISVDYEKEGSGSIRLKNTALDMLTFIISSRTPADMSKALVQVDADSDVGAVFVVILKGEDASRETITGPLASFEGDRSIPMLVIEGDYKQYDPAWLPGVEFREVQFDGANHPVPYAEFRALIGR